MYNRNLTKMQCVKKYPLDTKGEVVLPMPVGAEILKIGVENDIPQIFALVNPEAPSEYRLFELVSTDKELEELKDIKRVYWDTVYLIDDIVVIHIFERVKK